MIESPLTIEGKIVSPPPPLSRFEMRRNQERGTWLPSSEIIRVGEAFRLNLLHHIRQMSFHFIIGESQYANAVLR